MDISALQVKQTEVASLYCESNRVSAITYLEEWWCVMRIVHTVTFWWWAWLPDHCPWSLNTLGAVHRNLGVGLLTLSPSGEWLSMCKAESVGTGNEPWRSWGRGCPQSLIPEVWKTALSDAESSGSLVSTTCTTPTFIPNTQMQMIVG